jgi:two-component system cell cycle response regulator DivK
MTNMRILYVEDNEVNRALVERVMRARKCSVVFQDEGEGALEALAQDPTIDLILLDIELAGSMTGLDVIQTLRARNDHRPVVAVTAYAMMGDRERILEAGCDQYLPKPLVVTDLLNMIDHYEAEFAAKSAQKPAVEASAAVTLQPQAEVPAVATPQPQAEAPVAQPGVNVNGAKPAEAKADESKPAETRPEEGQAGETKVSEPQKDTEVKTAPSAAATASKLPGAAAAASSVTTPAHQAGQEQPVEDNA